MNWIRAALLFFIVLAPAAAQEPPDPCEALLGGGGSQPAWPGIVLEAATGDTLLIRLKDIGVRRVKLAGIQAPKGEGTLSTVSRFHLARLAKGLRVFVILDPPWKAWPAEVTAAVEDFSEAQLGAGLAKGTHEGVSGLSPYVACRCDRAEQRAKDAGLGLWGAP